MCVPLTISLPRIVKKMEWSSDVAVGIPRTVIGLGTGQHLVLDVELIFYEDCSIFCVQVGFKQELYRSTILRKSGHPPVNTPPP